MGQHRRGNLGRHRTAIGAVRIVGDGSGGWLLAPVGRPTDCVGRVGALAVALGIGGAIIGLPAVATADGGSGGSTGTTRTADDTAPSTGAEATRRPAQPARGDTAHRGPADSTDSAGARSGRGSTVAGGADSAWEPSLQWAIGMSLGQGIGSLFGDNIFGDLVGVVTGFNATLLLGIVGGIARFFVPAPVARPAAARSYLVEQVPAAGELFVMTGGVARPGAAAGPLVLTELATPGAAGPAAGYYVDTAVLLDGAGALVGANAAAPLLVSFRFSLDQLLSGTADPVDDGVEGVEDELVGARV